MSDDKKPEIVIFVAIVQFLSAAFFSLMALFSLLALIFGARWGIDDYVSKQVAHYSSSPNYSFGVTMIFGGALAGCLALMIFFLVLGIGLLKGQKFAWYLQVAVNIFGLLSMPLTFLMSFFMLPVSAILNMVTLAFFFQKRVRNFFKV